MLSNSYSAWYITVIPSCMPLPGSCASHVLFSLASVAICSVCPLLLKLDPGCGIIQPGKNCLTLYIGLTGWLPSSRTVGLRRALNAAPRAAAVCLALIIRLPRDLVRNLHHPPPTTLSNTFPLCPPICAPAPTCMAHSFPPITFCLAAMQLVNCLPHTRGRG